MRGNVVPLCFVNLYHEYTNIRILHFPLFETGLYGTLETFLSLWHPFTTRRQLGDDGGGTGHGPSKETKRRVTSRSGPGGGARRRPSCSVGPDLKRTRKVVTVTHNLGGPLDPKEKSGTLLSVSTTFRLRLIGKMNARRIKPVPTIRRSWKE